MNSIRGADRRALTLPEVLVVVTIVVLLAAILLPALARHRCEYGYGTSCMNNLHQLGIAFHDYANTHPRRLPRGASSPQLPAGTIPNTNLEPDQRLSWMVELLPFLEEDKLYCQFDQAAGWEAQANLSLSQERVSVLRCPGWEEFSSRQPWETNYVGVAGFGRDAASRPLGDPNIGAFGYDRRVALADVKDGTSSTLMVLESARGVGSWAQGGFATVRGLDPEDKPYLGVIGPFGGTHCTHPPKSDHSFGSYALWMDGSVRPLSDSISPEVLEALVTIAGGEEVPKDY